MINDGDGLRELSGLVVPRGGSLEATGDLFEPYRLVDEGGAAVSSTVAFFAELAACGRRRRLSVPTGRWPHLSSSTLGVLAGTFAQ